MRVVAIDSDAREIVTRVASHVFRARLRALRPRQTATRMRIREWSDPHRKSLSILKERSLRRAFDVSLVSRGLK